MRGNTVISTVGMPLIKVEIKSFSFLKIGTFDSSQLYFRHVIEPIHEF